MEGSISDRLGVIVVGVLILAFLVFFEFGEDGEWEDEAELDVDVHKNRSVRSSGVRGGGIRGGK